MIKNHIHTITITRKSEKHLFQIHLPKDTVKINSIQATLNADLPQDEVEKNSFPVEAGWLWLEFPSTKGLLPYYQEVRFDLPLYNQTIISLLPLDDIDIGRFWHQGRKKAAFSLNLCPINTLVSGYFIDRIGLGHSRSYQVKIYLNLTVKTN
jgi:hypothetical protein